MKLEMRVNGRAVEAEIEPGEALMPVLRRLGYTSVKNGCANGDCGACAVLVDGAAVNSCFVFAAKAAGAEVTTVEGLATDGELHPLQQASLAEAAVQCGFCTPGILLTAAELLGRNPAPTELEVRTALAGNLCRCTGYVKPVEAVLDAARLVREASP